MIELRRPLSLFFYRLRNAESPFCFCQLCLRSFKDKLHRLIRIGESRTVKRFETVRVPMLLRVALSCDDYDPSFSSKTSGTPALLFNQVCHQLEIPTPLVFGRRSTYILRPWITKVYEKHLREKSACMAISELLEPKLCNDVRAHHLKVPLRDKLRSRSRDVDQHILRSILKQLLMMVGSSISSPLWSGIITALRRCIVCMLLCPRTRASFQIPFTPTLR